jgi:signal transduction histidine kinase
MDKARPGYLPSWKRLLFAVAGNTLIALVLWFVGIGPAFGMVWVSSQCIGLSICCTWILFEWIVGDRWGHLTFAALAVVPGALLGVLIARLIGISVLSEKYLSDWRGGLRLAGLCAVFTLVFWWFFRSRERLVELEQARQAVALREVSGQKAALAARLRLLQAQIEPHFLFNTLANLHSLIGQDDAAARALLESLNEYLRASLAHSRAEQTTLGDECRLLESFLAIQARRMGGRLDWEISVPESLRDLPFPPMLFQPLVENAIRHGIEPKLGPGRLRIAVFEEGGGLALSVGDDGVGMTGKTAGSGVGLANVRERLGTLFGSAAKLELVETSPAGLTARIWIPKDALAR